MTYLDELESKSIYIIREAFKQFGRVAVLWSIGKDSTTMMWLVRKAFFGRVPFPALHIDTGQKFQEIYQFRDHWTAAWGIHMLVEKNDLAITNGIGPHATDKFDCCNQLKTDALKQAIAKHDFRALLLGIRRDEHGIRAKERVFSPRDGSFLWDYQNQPPELWDQFKSKQMDEQHLRIHPMLHWTELDIWTYIQRENIPIVDLYLSKNGQRYRSIGCATCCATVPSCADTIEKIIEELRVTKTAERSGRAQDKESAYTMQKLRSLGYM